MNVRWLDRTIWTLVFGGLLVMCLGVFVERRDEPLGMAFLWSGGIAAAVGAVLIGVRAWGAQGGER